MPTALEEPEYNVTKHGYMLERSFISACRLNLQFHLWKDALRFNIHPSITASFPTNHPLQIAEVGTGTGSWLVDTALERPKDSLTGFDIDLSQGPPKNWYPPNVKSLQYLNIFDDDIPDDLVGSFDIVHIRLFILVIENADPRPVLMNLKKLLRPGGWLQWEEGDPHNQHVYYANPDQAHQRTAIDKFINFKNSGGRHAWIHQLAKIMANEGFEQTRQLTFEDAAHMLQANSDQHFMTMKEFTDKLRTLGKDDDARKIEKMLSDAVSEVHSQGGAYNILKTVTMGRRGAV